jgi:tagatose-1,6-bisphosphate aldolase non-catalytic subunit AgaZ/GatZ
VLDRIRRSGRKATLLCLSPISKYVISANVKVSRELNTFVVFTASLNQIDRDGGYTGWTPSDFKTYVLQIAEKKGLITPIYFQLDHGGPWLKEDHIIKNHSYIEARDDFIGSLEAFIKAGFNIIHIDATIDLES